MGDRIHQNREVRHPQSDDHNLEKGPLKQAEDELHQNGKVRYPQSDDHSFEKGPLKQVDDEPHQDGKAHPQQSNDHCYKNACGNSWVMNHIQMERFIVRAAMIIACEKDALKKVDDELYPYGKIPRLKRNGHSS